MSSKDWGWRILRWIIPAKIRRFIMTRQAHTDELSIVRQKTNYDSGEVVCTIVAWRRMKVSTPGHLRSVTLPVGDQLRLSHDGPPGVTGRISLQIDVEDNFKALLEDRSLCTAAAAAIWPLRQRQR